MNERADQAEAPVVGLMDTFTAERELPPHSHRKGQLLYATEGAMLLHTDEGQWMLPPQRALWIPPGRWHGFTCRRRTHVHALYVAPEIAPFADAACRVIDVSPLLRELVGRAVRLPWSRVIDGPERRLMQVLIDELIALPVAPLNLPLPRDPRARRLCERLRAMPADATPLAHWARALGASERTLARIFRTETGLAFGAWRERLRMQLAVIRLAEGHTVTVIALDLGYTTTSGFIAAFRRVFGTTPGRYFRGGVDRAMERD